jgi:hypothetical protein
VQLHDGVFILDGVFFQIIAFYDIDESFLLDIVNNVTGLDKTKDKNKIRKNADQQQYDE